MPAAIVEKLYGALAVALKAAPVLNLMQTTAQIPGGQRPEEFTAFLRAESDKWKTVIAERGLLNTPR